MSCETKVNYETVASLTSYIISTVRALEAPRTLSGIYIAYGTSISAIATDAAEGAAHLAPPSWSFFTADWKHC